MDEYKKPEYDSELDPVDYYNRHKTDHALSIFEKKLNLKKIKEYEYNGALFENGNLKVEIENDYLIVGKKYSPFMLLSILKFKSNHYAAWTFVLYEFQNEHIPYIRVGVDYYKVLKTVDRFGIKRKEIKRWKKDTLIDDHGKSVIRYIPKFDGFIIEPNNVEYKAVVDTKYNLYSEFSHQPKEGEWKWIEILLQQIFGKYYELGLKYLQVMYLNPKQILPILVLGSEERGTGKTTFLNFMAQLFGENYTVISPQDFTSSFNGSYATKNIIGIEETVNDKSDTVNKIKMFSTGKFISVNQKFVDNYKLPFFGKFIITTNKPDKFLKIDEEEIRFWVHILKRPTIKNANIEDDLISEIPAFLNHLKNMPAIDNGHSRMVFTPDELKTDALELIKSESKSGLYKDLKLLIENWFNNNPGYDEMEAHPSDIKKHFFHNNSKIGVDYIRKVMKDEFKKEPELKRYSSFDNTSKIVGRVFTFYRNEFEDKRENEEIKDVTEKDDLPF